MVLPFHIIVALTSVVYTAYVFTRPSKHKLNIAFLLVGATLASGTYLVLVNSSNLVSACVTGLIYLGFVLPAIVSARHKLSRVINK